ncbi:hypothetical protein EYF80_034926 [Liparis tanakae]|uniref:Uncharacterized protein n=1 Tax=Liparis tanakae TaxID=230148 RepID=A0A4Z2GMZ8_9TELE|nr:hypothetical protein EYF80_034926 [Liparis tanakae]
MGKWLQSCKDDSDYPPDIREKSRAVGESGDGTGYLVVTGRPPSPRNYSSRGLEPESLARSALTTGPACRP